MILKIRDKENRIIFFRIFKSRKKAERHSEKVTVMGLPEGMVLEMIGSNGTSTKQYVLRKGNES